MATCLWPNRSHHRGNKRLLRIDSYLGQNRTKALQEIDLIRLDFVFFFHPSCASREVITLFNYDMNISKVKRRFFLPFAKL